MKSKKITKIIPWNKKIAKKAQLENNFRSFYIKKALSFFQWKKNFPRFLSSNFNSGKKLIIVSTNISFFFDLKSLGRNDSFKPSFGGFPRGKISNLSPGEPPEGGCSLILQGRQRGFWQFIAEDFLSLFIKRRNCKMNGLFGKKGIKN
uniref:hypothetical protein n=1 Tax=Cephaleuros karstenii TaxID=1985640 RepID=UPI001EDDC613|nr:hypothetical protein MFR52_pgp067 [Cephaleuros karstenii]UIB39092.1 hypothetical protein [Cephaleuros karstenii]